MNRDHHIGFEWAVIIALPLGAGFALAVSDIANLKNLIVILLVICFCISLHIKLIGNNPVIIILSFSVAWLFLCGSPLLVSHYYILTIGRWIALGLTAVAFFIAGVHAGKKLRLHRIVVFPFLMGVYFYFTKLWSISPELTVGRCASVMMLGAAVVGIAWYTGDSATRLVEVMKAVVLPVILFFWILTPIYGFDTSLIERGYLRTAGPMLNPNGIGVLGAFLLPISYYLWRTTDKQNIFWLGAFLTCVLMVILSATRSALSASLLAFTLIVISRKRFFSLGVLLIGVGALILSMALLLVEIYGIPEIVQSYLRVENLRVGGGRFEAWDVAVDLLRQRPLRGYGFGTEDILFAKFGIRFFTHGGAMVHNSYLGLSLQVGILGAAVFFFLIFLVVIKGIQASMKTKDLMFSILTGTLVAGLVISFTESWLYSAGNSQSLPFWILFGMLVRLLIRPKWAISEAFLRILPTQNKLEPTYEVSRVFR
jgi:O-antigen ligase